MNETSYVQQAFEAYVEGVLPEARSILLNAGVKAAQSSLALQLLSMTEPASYDALALLQLAALDVAANDASAHFNLAVMEQQVGRLSNALLRYAQTLRLDPQHHGALNNISDLLRRRGRNAEAWLHIETYLKAGGDPRGLEIRIAKIADNCHRSLDADRWFSIAAEADPTDQHIRWERAMQQLRDERFSDGWSGYEARRTIFEHDVLGLVNYSIPEWDGEARRGMSVLLHKEQGLGDMLMFASCICDLETSEMDVHLAVQPPLVRLFAHNFPWAQVWASTSTADTPDETSQRWLAHSGPIDRQLPIASLGRLIRKHGFPEPQPYLMPIPEDYQIWAARIEALTARTKHSAVRAGLVVAARRNDQDIRSGVDGAAKSLDATAAAQLDVEGVQWFGLHNSESAHILADIPRLDIVNCSDWLFDLADTSALIAHLDIVVAVDTAVAHLAGAMGKKTILLLPYAADWRWARSRATSYWYNDVTIIRQPVPGDWNSVVRDARAIITQFVDISQYYGI